MKQVVFGYCPIRLDSLPTTDSQQEIYGTKVEMRYYLLTHLGAGVFSHTIKGSIRYSQVQEPLEGMSTLPISELGDVSGIQHMAVCGLGGTFAPWAQARYTMTG